MSFSLLEQRQREQDFLAPSLPTDSQICGKWWTLPASTGRRIEGGKRLQQARDQRSTSAPLVSVITVVHDRAGTIAKCLESVRTQTYAQIEHLVIDGGSNDGTVDILQQRTSYIDYFVSEPDEGIYDAMNKGLGLASGEYIIFLNSDDWYRADAIELLLEAAERDEADIAHADAVAIDAKGREIGRIEHLLHAGLYTSACLIRHETMLVRRSVYEHLGWYDTSYKIIADYLFVMRAYYSGFRFSHVRKELLYFSNLGVSSTARDLRESERARLFSSLFPFLTPQDVDLLVRWPLPTSDLSALISRYPDQSELFVRSLVINIANAPSFLLAQAVFERLGRLLRHSIIWKLTGGMRRWVYERLGEFRR